MASHRIPAAVLAAIAIVLAACGGGSSTSATKMAADPARDQRTARALLLVQADFPTGWKAEPHSEDQATKAEAQRFDACAGIPAASTYTADEHSPDFKSGDVTEVDSEATFFRT